MSGRFSDRPGDVKFSGTLKFVGGRIVQNISALAALFFILVGTIRVWGFWAYVATVLGYQIISLLIILPKYPE